MVKLTGVKVLIVAARAELRSMLRMVLEEEGCEVFTASRTGSGLAIVRDEDPDFVICDAQADRWPDFPFLKDCREAGGSGLAIYMVGYGNREVEVRAMERGAYDLLPKPFTADELILTLKKAEIREARRGETFQE